jgi:hypothetical protein
VADWLGKGLARIRPSVQTQCHQKKKKKSNVVFCWFMTSWDLRLRPSASPQCSYLTPPQNLGFSADKIPWTHLRGAVLGGAFIISANEMRSKCSTEERGLASWAREELFWETERQWWYREQETATQKSCLTDWRLDSFTGKSCLNPAFSHSFSL